MSWNRALCYLTTTDSDQNEGRQDVWIILRTTWRQRHCVWTRSGVLTQITYRSTPSSSKICQRTWKWVSESCQCAAFNIPWALDSAVPSQPWVDELPVLRPSTIHKKDLSRCRPPFAWIQPLVRWIILHNSLETECVLHISTVQCLIIDENV